MTAQARRLLMAATLAFIGQQLSNLFVQAYMWDQAGTLAAMARFNLALFVGGGAAFAGLGAMVKRGRPVRAYQIGLILQSAFFMIVLALGDQAGDWLEPLGFVSGLGTGAFWLGQNTMIERFTDPANRARYWGLMNAGQTGAALAGPLVGGILIGALGPTTGYRLIFAGASVCIGLAALFVIALRTAPSDVPFVLKAGWKDREPERRWTWVLASQSFYGFRQGILLFLPAILVYAATGSATVMSRFAVITSASGMVAFWLAGRVLEGRSRFAPMLISSLLQAVTALAVVVRMDYTMLLVYTVAGAVFRPFQEVPYLALSFDAIGAGDRDVRVERIVARELVMVLGRVVGMLLLLGAGMVATSEAAAMLALVLVAVTAVVPALMVRRAA